jgi:hypothetical protein
MPAVRGINRAARNKPGSVVGWTGGRVSKDLTMTEPDESGYLRFPWETAAELALPTLNEAIRKAGGHAG